MIMKRFVDDTMSWMYLKH